MKQQKLELIIVTAVVFVCAVIGTVLFAREITQESQELKARVTAIAEGNAQEFELNKLRKLSIETESDRQSLASLYLASQSDSIDLLNFVEQLAGEESIDLITVSATETEKDGQEFLTIRYTAQASRAQVEQFIALLENIPYVSEVTSIRLNRQSLESWSANIEIDVLIKEVYETQ